MRVEEAEHIQSFITQTTSYFIAKSPAAEKARSDSILVGLLVIKKLYTLCKKSLPVHPFSNNSISF